MLLNFKSLLFLCSLYLIAHTSYGQHNIGQPFIHNYSKDVSKGGLRNWDIGQDERDIMYFANDEGLLSFDGINWKIYKVGNNTIVRSLFIDEDRIYVGSQGDIGYFAPDSTGILNYHSLKHLIPVPDQKFSDVWKINRSKDYIIFRTSENLFAYDGQIKVLGIEPDFSFILEENEKIFLHQLENRTEGSNSATFDNFFEEEQLKNKKVSGVIPLEDEIMVFTNDGYIFKSKNEEFIEWKLVDDQILKEHRIQCVEKIDDQRIAIGTLSNGLLIINTSGQILHHLNSANGLLSNEVLRVFLGNQGNLWFNQSNGISCIEINSAYTIITPDINAISPGYAVKIHKGRLYLGTSLGLYSCDLKDFRGYSNESNFQIIEGTKGQVWNLGVYNDELLLSHHSGTFRITGNKAVKISSKPGSWGLIPINSDKNILLEGTYNGLNIYEFVNGHWRFKNNLTDMINESCRILAKDSKNNIWVAHPYRGVYKITLDTKLEKVTEIKLYDKEYGFPSNWIHVFEVRGNILFTTEKGIYTYDHENDLFKVSESWSTIIDTTNSVQRLIEDSNGNVWYVVNNEIGFIEINDLGLEKQVKNKLHPKLNGQLVGGFEHIYPYDNSNVFIPTEQGFVHYNPEKLDTFSELFSTHIREVKLGDSTVIYGGYRTKDMIEQHFNHDQNAFTFKYSATEYCDFDQMEFQYILEGLDEKWSPWVKKNFKEYTSLPHGHYEFKIRSRNISSKISSIDSYSFSIGAPWYSTLLAKLIYCLLALLLLIIAFVVPSKKFEREKSEIIQEKEEVLQEKTEEYQKVVAKNQQEISKLQEEKLKSEIQFKNKELASTTIRLVQKGGLLNKLKDNLTSLQSKSKDPDVKKEIRSTLRMLNQNLQIDEDWEQFANYFDQVHVDFSKRLTDLYPQLTPKDQKMCTYLKMNLTTKEIVPLMNISVRGVEVSRYRLRKKLGLDSNVNLNDFMMKF